MKLPLTKLMIYRILLEQKEPITGYEMTKLIPYQHQGVYRILGQALQRGIVVMTREAQEGKPDRKYYTLKDKDSVKKEMTEALIGAQAVASITAYDIDVVLRCERHVGKQVILLWLQTVLKDFEHIIKDKKVGEHLYTLRTVQMLREEVLKRSAGLLSVENGADVALQ